MGLGACHLEQQRPAQRERRQHHLGGEAWRRRRQKNQQRAGGFAGRGVEKGQLVGAGDAGQHHFQRGG